MKKIIKIANKEITRTKQPSSKYFQFISDVLTEKENYNKKGAMEMKKLIEEEIIKEKIIKRIGDKEYKKLIYNLENISKYNNGFFGVLT